MLRAFPLVRILCSFVKFFLNYFYSFLFLWLSHKFVDYFYTIPSVLNTQNHDSLIKAYLHANPISHYLVNSYKWKNDCNAL